MGLLTFAGRIVLVVVNIVFILASLALIVGGFVLRFATDILDIQSILNQINSASSTLFDEQVDTSNFDLGSMLSGLATAMIILGVVLLALSFLGCCSACCNFTTLMLAYAIVLIVILSAQVIFIILALAAPDQLKAVVKTQGKESINNYEGLRGTSATSVGWNWVSVQYECCGVDNYEDFQGKGSWKGNSPKADGTLVVTPVVCCKNLPSGPTEKDNCAGKDGEKDAADIQPSSNLDKGCVDKVWTELVENRSEIYLTVLGICLAAQAVLIFFAILGYKDRGIKGGLV